MHYIRQYFYFLTLSVISHRTLITAGNIMVFTQVDHFFIFVIRTCNQAFQKFLYLLGRNIRKVKQLVVLGNLYPCMALFTLITKWFITFSTIHNALYFAFRLQAGAA
ncbi:hypothetical protein DPMN_156469 [Dreissena polymorpha]|uniref:Uncharacterized protein n=1 Tax=Dreissena polymorpha TaxID=45954 RepID=A0A9D4FUF7_DREPO|nr:hypothetical protein DPMN_156469 [Dreissena polymorpha]